MFMVRIWEETIIASSNVIFLCLFRDSEESRMELLFTEPICETFEFVFFCVVRIRKGTNVETKKGNKERTDILMPEPHDHIIFRRITYAVFCQRSRERSLFSVIKPGSRYPRHSKKKTCINCITRILGEGGNIYVVTNKSTSDLIGSSFFVVYCWKSCKEQTTG
jgi:hypothetical protein